MALKLNIENYELPLLFGEIIGLNSVNEIYIRVDRFTGELNTCRFVLGYYNQVVELIEGNEFVNLVKLNFPEIPYQFEMIEDGTQGDVNLRQQAYNYLKTLPKFHNCEDC